MQAVLLWTPLWHREPLRPPKSQCALGDPCTSGQTHQFSNYVEDAPTEETVAQVAMASPPTWRWVSSPGIMALCAQLYLFLSSSWP